MTEKAVIITIGDELLIGQTIDTNSAAIALALGKLNIEVVRRIAIADNRADIIETLDFALGKASIVVITGGLGPTADDITKQVLCDYFGGEMVRDQAVYEHLSALFAKRNMPMLARNAQQADVPDVCEVLFNAMGTAPGMLFRKGKKLVASLPGVPFEMNHILETALIPIIKKQFSSKEIVLHKHIITSGMPESILAEKIQDLESAFPQHVHLAYLPSLRLVKLRLTGHGNDLQQLASELETIQNKISARVSEFVIGLEDQGLEVYVSEILKSKNITLSTAESCTGGYFSNVATNLGGSSVFYKGGVITYANEVKINILGVSQATLAAHGAVSEETVVEMAKGAVRVLNSDVAISFSGILGPDGGTPTKPVGLVWIAVANDKNVMTKKLQLRYSRFTNKEAAANEGWALLRQFVMENYK